LAFDRIAGEGHCSQTLFADLFASHFTDAIRAVFDAENGFFDFIKCVLLVGYETECEISVKCIRASICFELVVAFIFRVVLKRVGCVKIELSTDVSTQIK